MKNKVILILLAIAIFIPSVVAIISYNVTNGAPVSARNVRSATLSDLDGKEFSFERGQDDRTIDFFLDMNSASAKISSLPEPLVGTNFFKLTMRSAKQQVDYQYYFSTSTTEAYYLNEKGEAFKIPADYVEKFVTGEYASSLYVNASVPRLYFTDTDTVLPKEATWMYKNASGTFVSCAPASTDEMQFAAMEGGVSLLFSMQPDYFTVKLTDTDTGTVVFNDLYDNIGNLSISNTMKLSVEIVAKWYEDAARDYYGEMVYAFDASIAAPAEFFLGTSEILTGEFTVVSATNIVDPSKIVFTSTPDIGYTPTFFLDGEYAIALLPIRHELAGGEYTLSFKYGGVTAEIPLTVEQRTVKQYSYDIGIDIINATRTEATVADFKAATAEATASGEGTQLWEGNFIEVVRLKHTSQYDGVLTLGFGHQRKINATGEIYTHEGVDYITATGAEVLAANNGKVVFAGYTAYGGNTVVIEHGYGLKTWYCHLSEIKVGVGDSVTKGATVGIAGASGFTKQNGVHTGMSVFDVPVSPYLTWEDPGIVIVR